MNVLLAWQRAPAAGKGLDPMEWLTPMLAFVAAVVVGAVEIGRAHV